MEHFVQEINPQVETMAPDKLLGFQAQVSKIPGIVQLTFGEPGFGVSDSIKDEAIKAIKADRSHYAESQGETELRQVALDYFNKRYHLNYPSVDNVIVTLGVTEAINVIFQTLLTPGDGLLVPEPAYGSYFASLTLAHGQRVTIDTSANAFKLTPAMVEETLAQADCPVKAILMNYPNNPTGVTYTEAELRDLAEVFKKHKLWVISDEIYSELTYSGDHVSLAAILPDQTIMVNGLSKSHAMTGYRVGFLLGEEDIIAEMQKVHGALTFATPTFIQDAARVALQSGDKVIADMRAAYQKRRDYAVKVLSELGFDIISPQGAFYIFAKIPAQYNQNGWDFALDLAENAKVALIPGEGFSDLPSAKAYVRLSYAADDQTLEEGLRRLSTYLKEQQ
ncbi:aminotransferase class I/II-fold pyridoxal phosphate-dependent enzyme [Eupransor demetentiae]|uniref:Aminotransferase n=1 Tax=Eupransor demetentiae TaxID=3109584 RepID=A0ABM9N4F2_9LACO|nr:Aspartate/methionine/tyrosine aminotransferase (AspB) [Lactobacillaceae bacterium LMG 33000]